MKKKKKKKKENRIVQTAKEMGDGRSDGHYIWQATANCCDADCILAKFPVIIKHALDILRSIIIKKLLLTPRVHRKSDTRTPAKK